MEQSKDVLKETPKTNNDSITARVYENVNSFWSKFMGVIITLGVAVAIFFIASLTIKSEIIASNLTGAKVLAQWREEQQVETFPVEYVDIVIYEEREYYFVVDTRNELTNEIEKWHFAFEGGFGYTFMQEKFMILTGITIMFSLFVAQINYSSASRKAMETLKFSQTMTHLQEQKKKVENITQYIPEFCSYKYKQRYEEMKQQIVRGANINYEYFISPKFDESKLAKWQRKRLKKIMKIKIIPLNPSDLLQEQGKVGKKYRFLPMDIEQHRRHFFWSGGIQRILTSILSGFVMAFSIVIKEWQIGIAYSLTILSSAFSARYVATDFVLSTLRNRYLAKASYLSELFNLREMFINLEKIKNAELEKIRIEEEKKEKQKNLNEALSKMIMVMPEVKFLPKISLKKAVKTV